MGAARGGLPQVGGRLVEERAGRRHDDHRHAPVDERDGAVLELAGGEAFGMDVGELLELERPFHGDGIAGAPPDIEHRRGLAQGLGEVQDALVVAQHVRDVGRDAGQRGGEAGFLRCVDSARARASAIAKQASVTSWAVKALVDATPISTPA